MSFSATFVRQPAATTLLGQARTRFNSESPAE